MNDKITVLFPGAFKPCHGGHISLISRYLEDSSVNEIKIFISPSTRGDIDQAIAVSIAKKLLSDIPNIKIEAVNASPITTAYEFMKKAEPGIYALAASSKETENTQRIQKFVSSHNSGKYSLPNNVKVVEMPINIDPLLYKDRTDDNNGKPISATILRKDILDQNFENFKTNYPGCSYDTINTIWNLLKYGGE